LSTDLSDPGFSRSNVFSRRLERGIHVAEVATLLDVEHLAHGRGELGSTILVGHLAHDFVEANRMHEDQRQTTTDDRQKVRSGGALTGFSSGSRFTGLVLSFGHVMSSLENTCLSEGLSKRLQVS